MSRMHKNINNNDYIIEFTVFNSESHSKCGEEAQSPEDLKTLWIELSYTMSHRDSHVEQ